MSPRPNRDHQQGARSERPVEITLLHRPDCTVAQIARDRITDALALSGVKGDVSVVEVSSVEDAARLGVVALPAVLIDGAPAPAEASDGALRPVPSLAALVTALRPFGTP